MKYKSSIICLLLIPYSLTLCAQQDSGFTNKAEAKNLRVNGKKEGKWVEYVDLNENNTKDTNAPYYFLTLYKSGTPYGLVKEYYKSGKIFNEIPYVNGKIDGVEKQHYESGKIMYERPYEKGKCNGVTKGYYESGKLEMESPHSYDKIDGILKRYYESGKLKSETTYIKDVAGVTKNYDESGNEIK